MISGIGIDIVEIARFKKSIQEYERQFLERVFTNEELQYAQSKKDFIQHLAARFAAKEAVAKAIATGWSGGFRWKDVEVSNDSLGKPTILLSGKMKRILEKAIIHLSISHSEKVVVASVIVEKMNK